MQCDELMDSMSDQQLQGFVFNSRLLTTK